MKSFSRKAATAGAAILVVASMSGAPAQARDFFSNFFGAVTGRAAAPTALPFANENDPFGQPPAEQPKATQSASAYCVRTCDGRYFPISSVGSQSRAEICKSFCPASETKVVYGGGIDNARTDGGKPYSELPNAFRYRNELVAGCTCNGKDSGGLAHVDIKDDPTVRRGDLVANADGKMSAAPKTSASAANYSPRPRVARIQNPFAAFAAQ
jgi:hypothetical protein